MSEKGGPLRKLLLANVTFALGQVLMDGGRVKPLLLLSRKFEFAKFAEEGSRHIVDLQLVPEQLRLQSEPHLAHIAARKAEIRKPL